MEQEKDQSLGPACVLCGTRTGSYKFYHFAADESLYLCVDCLKDVTKSLTRDQLAGMTTEQLTHHMKVRDELHSTYKNSFTATRKFCIGKRRTVPIIEVDEERGLWALPKASMPLALSLSSIVDVEVSLHADGFDDDELADEIGGGIRVKDVIPYLRTILNLLYQSKHTDLAPIPDGKIVSYLYLILTLDDKESGISRVEVDLLPFWFSLPSRVDAGYDCAYELIVFLKELASDAYKKRKSRRKIDLTCNNRLFTLVATGVATDDEGEILRYYLERVPAQGEAEDEASSYRIVRSVIDTVSEYLLFGEKAPDFKTQHTTNIETFLGAFYRYAPGLSVSDVVCIMDNTRIQSGKGGMLFAQEGFAADGFVPKAADAPAPSQPIWYDDLLYVGMGTGKSQLVLIYRDGTRLEVNGGKYAHFIFVTVNCILLLRPSE